MITDNKKKRRERENSSEGERELNEYCLNNP